MSQFKEKNISEKKISRWYTNMAKMVVVIHEITKAGKNWTRRTLWPVLLQREGLRLSDSDEKCHRGQPGHACHSARHTSSWWAVYLSASFTRHRTRSMSHFPHVPSVQHGGGAQKSSVLIYWINVQMNKHMREWLSSMLLPIMLWEVTLCLAIHLSIHPSMHWSIIETY